MNKQLSVIEASIAEQQQMEIDVSETATLRVEQLKKRLKRDQIQSSNRGDAVGQALKRTMMQAFPIPSKLCILYSWTSGGGIVLEICLYV